MKKSRLILPLSLTAVLITCGLVLLHKKESVETKAYEYVSTLPTTIDLNDSSSSEIRSYYSSLNNLSANERKGENLLKNLKTILSNNQRYYSYDDNNGTQVWQMYEITDRDWDMSPASSTTYGTYNASTNKITNYQYGTSAGNSKNNPYIHSLYTNRDVTNEARAWGDHTQTNWGLNREHLWPKSQGFESEGSGGARGDPMHLWAGNGYVNNVHSNYYYGKVGYISTDCGSSYYYTSGNYLGTSSTLGSGTVFEPQDSDKGDVARSIFYMVARYNNIAGNDNNINQDNPNLTLDDNPVRNTRDSTATMPSSLGILHDLLEWHKSDPVDEYEIHRNNLLYKNYTNNRNPFIDFPEWADYIWGTPEANVSYSSPTGSATPSSDIINGYHSAVAPTSITLSETNVTLEEGGSTSIAVTSVNPSNASKSVNWSSANTNVATVNENGVINAIGEGNTTITATSTMDSNVKATVSVTVIPYVAPDNGAPLNGIAYKLYFTKNNINYYSTGTMSGYYGATSNNYSSGVYIYFEKNGTGQNMYFMNGSTKTYIILVQSGTYYNFTLSTSNPSQAWIYDADRDSMYMTFSQAYYLGALSTNNYYTMGGYYASNSVCFAHYEKTAEYLSYQIINKITCDGVGLTAPTFASGCSWNDLSSIYSNLNQVEKDILLNANANISGSLIERAMARYDLIARKYSSYNNFISRPSANSMRFGFVVFKDNYTMLIIIASASIVAICGVAFLLIRKKQKR